MPGKAGTRCDDGYVVRNGMLLGLTRDAAVNCGFEEQHRSDTGLAAQAAAIKGRCPEADIQGQPAGYRSRQQRQAQTSHDGRLQLWLQERC